MPAPTKDDRARLEGCELDIFQLVRRHATPEQWREWLRVPLQHAAADGNEDLFNKLMGAGADVRANWRGWHGQTLLAAAARGNSKKIVLALLKAGAKAEVNARFGVRNESALHISAGQGAEEVSRVLVEAGADPNIRCDGFYSHTPLHEAAEAGHHVVVGMLLSKGALPNAKTATGKRTALHFAAVSGHELCVSELLLAGANKDLRDRCGLTPLHLAAQLNHLAAVEQLLAADAKVDALDSSGGTPLMLAARNGHANCVRALVQHGSSVDAPDGDGGCTALHHAAEVSFDSGDTIRVLLEAGANIEAKTTVYGNTPLHIAVHRRTGRNGTTYALLKGGASVNARDGDDDTPLHIACSRSCVGAVELLLMWGADETLVNQCGSTPADEMGQWEYDDYLIEDGVSVDEEEEEERKADDQRIRHMLAHAPAYRPWGRRGWLVLARSRPARVKLANGSSRSSNVGSSTRVTRASSNSGGGGDGDGDQAMVDLQRLVGRVVGLDAEGVFRLVVGFL